MPTALPPPGDPDVLYVVDLSGYVYRAYHALPPMSTSRGEPTHAVYGVTQMLLALVQQQQPARLAVALDPAGPSFRKEIYPEYKATRPAPPEDLREQIDRLEEVIEAYAIPCFVVPGFEADDVIATVVERAREAGLRTVVVSADKDLLQLVRDDVLMFDTMRDRIYGREETVAKMGVEPEQVRDYLALTGDSSDNVPGVKSVGPKTAATLLGAQPTLDAIYENLDEIKRKGTRAKLTEFKKEAYLSRDLVSLRADVPLEMDLSALHYGGADQSKLRSLFSRLEFHRLLAQLAPPPPALDTVEVVHTESALEALLDEAKAEGEVGLYVAAEGDDVLRAVIAGVALAPRAGRAAYIPTGHLGAGAPTQLSVERVASALRSLFDAGVSVQLGDTKRTLGLLHRWGVALPTVGFDSMLASYLVDPERHGHSLEEISQSELHRPLEGYDTLTDKRRGSQKALCDVAVERVGLWAGLRADLVRTVPRLLAPRLDGQGLRGLLEDVELPLARVLTRMEHRGVRVDVPLLQRLSAEYTTRIDALETQAHALAGHPFKITSPRALETVLFDELELRVVKKTKTARSTDHEVLEELRAEHPLPEIILEHRSLTKLRGTYLDALPRAVHPDTGRIHTRFNQAVAATGRMSSSEPNLQNIPIRTDAGRAIRDAFIPRAGWRLMSADYSQIELRVLAHLSEDPELVDAFVADEDVHVRTARALFDVEEPSRSQRGDAKTVNYAVIYGQTQFALARNLGIERGEAARYIEAFFSRYAGVAAFMEETVEQARQSGGVRTLLDRWRTLPDIRSRNRGLRSAAERVARNTPIQGTAADIIKLAMVRLDAAMTEVELDSRMLLTVHDELVFEVAPGEDEALEALVRTHMEGAMALKVPLVVDVGIGPTWNAAH
ncbi:MAG: DNA polymerase I [Sandaracinaceae bacterium]